MIFLIPVWLQIVFFIIGNAPDIIKVILMLKDALKDVKDAKEKKAIMEACKADVEAYKKDKDLDKLKAKVVAMKTQRAMSRDKKK